MNNMNNLIDADDATRGCFLATVGTVLDQLLNTKDRDNDKGEGQVEEDGLSSLNNNERNSTTISAGAIIRQQTDDSNAQTPLTPANSIDNTMLHDCEYQIVEIQQLESQIVESVTNQQEQQAGSGERAAPNEQQRTSYVAANTNDGSGGLEHRRYRPQKYCAVCGDRAIACNFNAVTCESCKAFFRRNAFKDSRLKCLFDDKCIINRVTRRFCSKCRLFKCFQTGMKKEWILTNEAKQIKRVKILQNKQSKQQNNNESSSSSTSTSAIIDSSEAKQSNSMRNNLSQRIELQRQSIGVVGHKDASTSCPDEAELRENPVTAPRPIHYCSMVAQCQYCSLKLNAINAPMNSKDCLVTTIEPLTSGCQSQQLIDYQQQQYHHLGIPTLQIRLPYNQAGETSGSYVDEQSQPNPHLVANSCCHPNNINRQQIFNNQQPQFSANNQRQHHHHHQPAQLHVLAPPQPQVVQYRLATNDPHSTSANMFAQQQQQQQQQQHSAFPINHHHLNSIQPQFSHTQHSAAYSKPDDNVNPFLMALGVKPLYEMQPECSIRSAALIRQQQQVATTLMPGEVVSTSTATELRSHNNDSPPESIDSTTTPESSPMMSQDRLENSNHLIYRDELYFKPADTEDEMKARIENLDFSDTERQSLQELIEATGFIFEHANQANRSDQPSSHQNEPLNELVYFCDAVLRRLIKTVKQIKTFRSLGVDDQIVLLKTACFKILLLRSVYHYRSEIGGWVDTKSGKVMTLEFLKRAKKSSIYEKHKDLVNTIPEPMRKDRLVVAIMTVALLFDASVELKHPNSTGLDKLIYLSLLRKYLILTQQDPLTKYETLVSALENLNACSEEYNVFFSKDFEPEQITPLLIEIFDIPTDNSM